MQKLDILKLYNQINEFGRVNQMHFTVIEPGHIEYRMPILNAHLATPVAAHGGAVAGMMDGVLGVAALSVSAQEQKLVATVEFKIQYIRPVVKDDVLKGIGKVDFKGSRIIISSGDIYSEKRNVLVAKGTGTFNAYPFEKSGIDLSQLK